MIVVIGVIVKVGDGAEAGGLVRLEVSHCGKYFWIMVAVDGCWW
jgi:hypothetical protein